MGRTGFFFSKLTFLRIKHCIDIGAWVKSWQLPHFMRKNLTHYGLNSGKRPPPISDYLGLEMRSRLLEVRVLKLSLRVLSCYVRYKLSTERFEVKTKERLVNDQGLVLFVLLSW